MLPVASYDHFARDDVGLYLCGRSYHQFLLIELDDSFDRTINEKVLVAKDFALHEQARPEPRMIYLQISWLQFRNGWRVRLLAVPHGNLPGCTRTPE